MGDTISKKLMQRLWFRVTILTVLIGLIGISGLLVYNHMHANFLPSNIRAKISFVTLFPNQDAGITVDRKTIKYDDSTQLLSYIAGTKDGKHITFSEQATPGQFIDIPDIYPKLVEHLGQYAAFDSVNGQVFLTRSIQQGNKQVAVMNAKGVLLFARADKDSTTSFWTNMFNNLVIHK